MKMKSNSTLFGIKASQGEVEGNKFSSTTFYLPADVASNANVKAIGAITVPYKCGDASEFNKWAHLEKSFPPAGLPVECEFDVVAGKDAQGKDAAKIVLVAIRPLTVAPRAV
jgi:hypothetical protein